MVRNNRPGTDKRLSPHDSDLQRADQLATALSTTPATSSSHPFQYPSDHDNSQPNLPPPPCPPSSPTKQTARRRTRNPFLDDAGLSDDECLFPLHSLDHDTQDSSLRPALSRNDIALEGQSNSKIFSSLLKDATKLEVTKLDNIHLTDEDLLVCRDALRLSNQRASLFLTPRVKYAPRMAPRPKYGANRSALSSAVDIFESAIEVVQETVIERPLRSEASNVQKSIVERTLEKVMLRVSWEAEGKSTEKLIFIMLFHLDADFVRPQVSFEVSGNAESIQTKCYDAAVKWLSLRATLPAVLNDYETQWEHLLRFANIRLIYGQHPDISTKKDLWDMMAILGLREYLHSAPAVRAVFRSRIVQIYAAARDTLKQDVRGAILPAAVVGKTLNSLRSQDSHGGMSWMTVRKNLERVALHAIHVLLYRCEAIPPDMRVAIDDMSLAVMCAEAALQWQLVRDGIGPTETVRASDASDSALERSLASSLTTQVPSSQARSSPFRWRFLDEASGLLIGIQAKVSTLRLENSSKEITKVQGSRTSEAGSGDEYENECTGFGFEASATPGANSRATNGTPSPKKTVRFETIGQNGEVQTSPKNVRQVVTQIQHAVEMYTVVDDPLPVVNDVPSVPLHWHFVHDPDDFRLSKEQGQKGGMYFGVSLESLRVRHWPKMSLDQRSEASRLRSATIESYEAAKTSFQELRVEVSGTNIAATIATKGSDWYPDRREKVPVAFTELCRRHLVTLHGDKRAKVKRCLTIADTMETMNGHRQQAQLEHLRASGDFAATWKDLRDIFIRDCASRGETVLGRGLDEAVGVSEPSTPERPVAVDLG